MYQNINNKKDRQLLNKDVDLFNIVFQLIKKAVFTLLLYLTITPSCPKFNTANNSKKEVIT